MRFPSSLSRLLPWLPTCLALLLSVVPQAGPSGPGPAMPFARTGHVSVELSADVEAAVPGELLRLGLRQTIDEGYTPYWRNPGDSGRQQLEWHLPPGVTAGPVLRPLPEAIPISTWMNYGYEGEAFLMTELAMPVDWPVGKPVEIGHGRLAGLFGCLHSGIRRSGHRPSQHGGPVRIHLMNGLAFEQAQERLPRRLKLDASHADEGDTITLAVDGLPAQGRIDDAYFFAGEAGSHPPYAVTSPSRVTSLHNGALTRRRRRVQVRLPSHEVRRRPIGTGLLIDMIRTGVLDRNRGQRRFPCGRRPCSPSSAASSSNSCPASFPSRR
ncbi:MAG: protein-disulfide reductase DsbD family protein [Geminicoccaceae bacterium]